MAVGASFADLAIILIDAKQGVLVQTKRHARICALMGIKYFVFAVNKMDLVGYSEERFNEITKQIDELSKELGLASVKIIPVSATEGDNITVKSDNTPWYPGEALLTYLENVDVSEKKKEEGFYMPVQRVCRPDHTFRGFQGQIESGVVSVGDDIITLPSGESAKVKSILVGDKDSQSAQEGQPVTIQLDKEVDVSRGCVLEKDTDIKVSSSITATLLWMDDDILENGKNYFVKLGTKMIPGIVTEIVHTVDVNTGEEKKADKLSKNEIALCTISLADKIVVDEFKNHKTLGELILIDRVTNMTSACGVVEKVNEGGEGLFAGRVDRNVRAALNGQKAVAIAFSVERQGVSRSLLEKVEKELSIQGKHTYLYAPGSEENISDVIKHLHHAGVITLLLVEEKYASTVRIASEEYYHVLPEDIKVETDEIVKYIDELSAYDVRVAGNGEFI